MPKRFAAIWFRHLTTDYMVRKDPTLLDVPFVLATPVRGRMIVQAVNNIAQSKGVYPNMVVANCRAILPELKVINDLTKPEKLLTSQLSGVLGIHQLLVSIYQMVYYLILVVVHIYGVEKGTI